MSLLDALILGIVQGLTEFLPVSSSGHLVLGQAMLGVSLPGVLFEIVVHLATLCAVVWVYRARIADLVMGLLRGRADAVRYTLMLILASLPAAFAGTVFSGSLTATFDDPSLAAVMLLITGILVYSLRFTAPRAVDDEPGALQAVLIGVAQALAILPGLSRSGATVAVGAWRGVEVVHVAEFSFLMSIPAILGAALLKSGEISTAGLPAGVLATGFAASLVAGVFAIQLFVRMLDKATLHRFAYYCWAVGAAYLAWETLGGGAG